MDKNQDGTNLVKTLSLGPAVLVFEYRIAPREGLNFLGRIWLKGGERTND